MPQWARAAGARCSAVSTVPCTFCRTQIVHQRWEIQRYFHHLLPWGFPETWNLEQTCPSILIGFCWGMSVVFSSSSLKNSQNCIGFASLRFVIGLNKKKSSHHFLNQSDLKEQHQLGFCQAAFSRAATQPVSLSRWVLLSSVDRFLCPNWPLWSFWLCV